MQVCSGDAEPALNGGDTDTEQIRNLGDGVAGEKTQVDDLCQGGLNLVPVSYTHLTLPTTPY